MTRWLPLALLWGCFAEFPPPAAGEASDAAGPRERRDMVPFLPPRDAAAPPPFQPPPQRPDAAPRPPAPDAAPPPPADPPPEDPGQPPDRPPPPPPPDPPPPPPDPSPGPEACDGVDNDRDDSIDEAPSVCADYIVNHCTLSLGWATGGQGPPEGAPQWSTCPAQGDFSGPGPRCANTDQSPAFGVMAAGTQLDERDEFGVQLVCAGPAPAVDDWVQRRCRFELAWATDVEYRHLAVPGVCGGVYRSPNIDCVTTGGDGAFHKLRLPGSPGRDDGVVVRWICEDGDQLGRSVSASGAVEVFVGWVTGDPVVMDVLGVFGDGAPDWGFCPGARRIDEGPARCVSTSGDTWPHWIEVDDPLGQEDHYRFGLMWRPR